MLLILNNTVSISEPKLTKNGKMAACPKDFFPSAHVLILVYAATTKERKVTLPSSLLKNEQTQTQQQARRTKKEKRSDR